MLWRRLCALLVGVAFVFATTEAFGHHLCPFHDGIAANSDAMPGMHGAHGAHHHMPAPGHPHQCTCLGASCCTVAITAPSDRLVALPVVPVRVVRTAAAPRRADPRPASHDDLLLPPPLGPPALLPV
jgi:hypothetical protein